MKKMKTSVKSLLWGLLIGVGITSCSDDTIENGQGTLKGDATPAYLTLSFSTNGSNGSRSTSETGAVNGDSDGNAEDSGHYNTGTAEESKVNTVLVVACPVEATLDKPAETGVGFAKLYGANDITTGTDQTNKNYWIYADKITYGGSKENRSIELGIGTYKLLVIINPVEGLMNKIKAIWGDASTETSKLSQVRDIYAEILDGEYEPGAEIYKTRYLNTGEGGMNAETTGFMMGNQKESAITLTEENTPDNPAHADVVVERMLSKITFRPKQVDNKDSYTYPIEIECRGEIDTVVAAVILTEDGSRVKQTLYHAKDLNGKDVYTVTIKATEEGQEDKFYAFKKGTGTSLLPTDVENVTEEVDNYEPLTAVTTETTDANQYRVSNADDPEASLTYEMDNVETRTFNVTIEGYALINLSKKVNYLRHTVYASDNERTEFGTLNGENFLWTPGWIEKNAVKYNEDGSVNGTVNFGTWFHNTLADVVTESQNLKYEETDGTISLVKGNDEEILYYRPMSAMTSEAKDSTVTGGNHYGANVTNPTIGHTMGYCLENSTDIEHQTHGLSTAISFMATITDENGEEVTAMYKYGGHIYFSLADIQNAYGAAHFVKANPVDGEPTFAELVKREADATTAPAVFTKEELAAFKIVQYQENVCYYYTNEIKHFDNGNNAVMGNMEFAIMRNNIYSIAISDIDGIGDPYVDPTPGILDETGKAALDIEVRILPWVVRYNDIDF